MSGKYRKTTKKSKGWKSSVPKAVKSYVNKQIHRNIENKYFCLDLSTYWNSVGSAWIERDLCYPAQGSGIDNRTGQEIKIRSLEIKGVIVQGSSSSALDDAYNVMRIVIGLYDGSSFTPLADATVGINDPITPLLNTSSRLIRKLYDQYITLTVTSTEKGDGDGYTPAVRKFNYYKYFKTPLTIKYGDNTTLVQNHRLMLSVISDSGAVVNPGLTHGYTKVMFEDG